jgi:hypothetical protein
MKPFDYIKFVSNKTLLKEDKDYVSAEKFDYEPQEGPNDPLGPDETNESDSFEDGFENIDDLPEEVQELVGKWSELETTDYRELKKMQDEFEAIGWTFDFGLDGIPYGLRPKGDESDEDLEETEVSYNHDQVQDDSEDSQKIAEYGDQDDYYINVSVRNAKLALEILRDEFSNEYKNKIISLDGTNSYVINDREVAMELYDALKAADIEITDTDVEVDDNDWDGKDDEIELEGKNNSYTGNDPNDKEYEVPGIDDKPGYDVFGGYQGPRIKNAVVSLARNGYTEKDIVHFVKAVYQAAKKMK